MGFIGCFAALFFGAMLGSGLRYALMSKADQDELIASDIRRASNKRDRRKAQQHPAKLVVPPVPSITVVAPLIDWDQELANATDGARRYYCRQKLNRPTAVNHGGRY